MYGKVGANQKLFGSITSTEIASALAEKGITLDKRLIVMQEPIKTVGTYKVNIKYTHQLAGTITVHVEDLNAK